MNQYELFDVDDFISDEYFIEWVLNPKPEHITFWDNWQLQYPQHVSKLAAAKRIISTIKINPIKDELTELETNQLITSVQNRISTKPSLKFRFTNSTWAAAAAILTISITSFWFFSTENSENPTTKNQNIVATRQIEYKNTSNENKLVRFSDGSLAILKPQSKLNYPNVFVGKNRIVHLEGEAFFEVQRNLAKPFLVYSQDMVTQVVGTSFSVTAFGKSDEFKVVVNTGKVKVYQNSENSSVKTKEITLIPHQQSIYKRSKTSFKKDTVQSKLLLAAEVANQAFTLNKVSLSEVIVKLEEAYGIQISYNKEQLGNLPLTAQLASLPLDQKVELICKAINATCKFSNGNIFIYK